MKYENYEIITNSPEKTRQVASEFAKELTLGDIVLLSGDLGAGKTVFTKGFTEGRGGSTEEVTSPTFTIMNEYAGGVNHFDLYRLNSVDEFYGTGMVEAMYASFVSVIEWPEVVGLEFFPETAYVVKITKLSDTERKIEIKRNKKS